jgi:hypothetical protein
VSKSDMPEHISIRESILPRYQGQVTTIRVHDSTLEKINAAKIYERETAEDVINRLLDSHTTKKPRKT